MTPVDAKFCDLRKSAAQTAVTGTNPVFIRQSAVLAPLDPLDWLEAQPPGNRLYWQGRDGEIIAGSGAAHLIAGKASECAQQFLGLYLQASGDLAHVRYFGGMAFDKTAVDERWAPFNRCRFQLLESMIRRDPNGNCEASVYRVANVPAPSVPPSPKKTAFVLRETETSPNAKQWESQVQSALGKIHANELQKVVLAGLTATPLEESTCPFSLLRQLRETSNDAFVFAFEPIPNLIFIGASPERLYRREGTQIFTEALAGTRKRGTTPQEDEALANELLHADKDHREQQIVLEELIVHLSPLCESINTTEAEPELLRQTTVQHLIQHVRGTLKKGVLDHDVIRAIHPTPAVGGRPRQTALDFIHKTESFSRGWYAAPVGWLSPKSAEFAVAIRSALIVQDTLYTFAGAGIVKGSDPAREWDEIQQKQKLILNLVLSS